MSRSLTAGLRFIQALLLLFSIGAALIFILWMVGSNGFGLVSGSFLPSTLANSDAYIVPYEEVVVSGAPGVATAAAAQAEIGGALNNIVQGDGSSEFYGNGAMLSFWSLTAGQHIAWTAVRAAPALGLAAISWLLFRVLQDVRNRREFTNAVSRRLLGIGLLVLIGMPVLQAAKWAVARWLVESSKAAAIAEVPPFTLDLWPVVIGLVIVVVGFAWRGAASLNNDLQGVV